MLDRDNQDYVRVRDNYIDRDTKIMLDRDNQNYVRQR